MWTIHNYYLDHLRYARDTFETIRPLKIIFCDYIFKNFRLKMSKNTFFTLLWVHKSIYYFFKAVSNENFR